MRLKTLSSDHLPSASSSDRSSEPGGSHQPAECRNTKSVRDTAQPSPARPATAPVAAPCDDVRAPSEDNTRLHEENELLKRTIAELENEMGKG